MRVIGGLDVWWQRVQGFDTVLPKSSPDLCSGSWAVTEGKDVKLGW